MNDAHFLESRPVAFGGDRFQQVRYVPRGEGVQIYPRFDGHLNQLLKEIIFFLFHQLCPVSFTRVNGLFVHSQEKGDAYNTVRDP